MTKLCKQYLADVKAFFPIMGKPERTYLAKLAENVDDYCIEEKTTTIEEIYDGFGHPSEVASTYLTSVDTSYLIKRIQMTKLSFTNEYTLQSYNSPFTSNLFRSVPSLTKPAFCNVLLEPILSTWANASILSKPIVSIPNLHTAFNTFVLIPWFQ